MRIHLINPSDVSFGIGVITPRWLYVLAEATPRVFGDPVIVDETLESLDPATIAPGDIVGIGIHTGQRAARLSRSARSRASAAPRSSTAASTPRCSRRRRTNSAAPTRWSRATATSCGARRFSDCVNGTLQPLYDGGRVEPEDLLPARWDVMPPDRYMWASVQTVRGCPKHCSFCSVWKTDGQRPRQRASDGVIREVVELRRRGFRFIALADDNFYPVTLTDLQQASRRADKAQYETLKAIRDERFELMRRLAEMPDDMIFFTQITMEAAEDPEFLDAMRNARIKGALVGVESVTAEGLKDVHKGFNEAGEQLVDRLRAFKHHGVHVLGSFIFGLPSDGPSTFDATVDVAQRAGVTFAQFVMLTPFPGTNDFAAWEKEMANDPTLIAGTPLTRHWLIPDGLRPKVYTPHPVMSADDIRQGTQGAWDRFYSFKNIWERAHCVESLKSRLAFVLVSKLYRQMYANTGIATDSARVGRAAQWARWIAKPTRRFFAGRPMPDLTVPA